MLWLLFLRLYVEEARVLRDRKCQLSDHQNTFNIGLPHDTSGTKAASIQDNRGINFGGL